MHEYTKVMKKHVFFIYHVKSLVSRYKIGSSIRFLSPYRAEKLAQRLRDSIVKVALNTALFEAYIVQLETFPFRAMIMLINY